MTVDNSTKTPLASTLLTLDEVAESLQIARRTVAQLVRRGHLRAIEVAPRRLRVSDADLQAYLDARVVEPEASS
jgi:excisionase family DNA binding protein